MRKLSPFSVLLVLSLMIAPVWAQQGSPRETVKVDLSGKQVTIEYGRPALGGRSFEALMQNLPADRMWRAGSEQVTTFTTEGDVLIGGQKVPAGRYSLYIHVAENGPYHLAVNKAVGQPLGKIWQAAPAQLAEEPWPHFNYQKEIGDREVARVALQASTNESPVDRFTIRFEPHGKTAKLVLAWGDQSWSTEIASAKPKSEGSHGG